jgi:hypothetical protein
MIDLEKAKVELALHGLQFLLTTWKFAFDDYDSDSYSVIIVPIDSREGDTKYYAINTNLMKAYEESFTLWKNRGH